MLFKWRRQLREGRLDGVMHRQAMLPVTIIDAQPVNLASVHPIDRPNTVTAQEVLTDRSGVIEIQMAGAVVRFDGKADLTAIRAVLGMLRP
jgi:transposase-like protein